MIPAKSERRTNHVGSNERVLSGQKKAPTQLTAWDFKEKNCPSLARSLSNQHDLRPSVPDGFEDEEQVDCEEAAGDDAEPAERLPRRRAQLGVVVGVERDHADRDQQRAAHEAQQRLLKRRNMEPIISTF